MTCPACDNTGVISVSVPGPFCAALNHETKVNYTYRCVCPKGMARNPTWPVITDVMTRTELDQLFPDGVPACEADWTAALQRAGVPAAMRSFTLETYVRRFGEDKLFSRYVEWAKLWMAQPIHERSDLVLYGPNGTGKTGMAISIARGLVEEREAVRFIVFSDLLRDWRDLFRTRPDGEAAPSEKDFMASLVSVGLLVMDEVSGAKATAFVEQTLTMVTDARQRELRPTIITLNTAAAVASEHETQVLAAMLGPALLDRLRERGQFWPLQGASRRRAYRRRG